MNTPIPHAFSLSLPRGFISLPLSEFARDDDSLARCFSDLLGLDDADDSSAIVASAMADFGNIMGDNGLEFAAIGLFRSPSAPTRPVSVLLTCARISTSHSSVRIEIAALTQIHQAQGSSVEILSLPAGKAVSVVNEAAQIVGLEGKPQTTIINRQVTAWIPEPSGDTIAVVSVASPSWPDWEHICDLALGLFDSFEWEIQREPTS